MYTPIVTFPTGAADPELPPGTVRDLPRRARYCLARRRAHRWILNAETDTLTGVMQWTEYEAIAMGTEALQMEVA